ncbi:phage GP46 family protein [Novosphingobium sp. NDB2Meth1]|uniref:phage GP46 family protein n=1 Tax=Novosphingobium sp. NDB2Meth1 TaxID=1892847 RepID=UPI00092FFEAD|nr:phage GP46 family protein [Novosphingobium sp. NDB2Meth1]
MIDLALEWNNDTSIADLVLSSGALQTHSGLRSAILISLFSDARADDTAILPEEGGDRGGWWGDDFGGEVSSAAADRDDRNAIGSRLWLLRRSKVTQQVLRDARQHVLDALGWLIRDGIASAVSVEVEVQGDRLAIAVTLDRPTGPARERYDFTWEASVS